MIDSKEIALARKCLESALQKGAQKVRVTLNKSIMDLAGTLNGELDKTSHCLDRSLSINLIVDGRFGSFSTNRIEDTDSFLDKAIDKARMLAPDQFRDLPAPERTAKDAKEGTELGLYDPEYSNTDAQARIETALAASIFKSAPEGLISEEAEYTESITDTLIMDSNGLYCRHTETSFDYGVEMTVQDAQGNKFSGYWWDSSNVRKELDTSTICPIALERARAQMGPVPHPGGKTCLVLDPEVSSRVVSPVLKALSAYSIQQNNSFLTGKLGEKVFPDSLTIIDDCRVPLKRGSYLFDSEGVATKTVPIIEKGVVKEYFVNTYMAGKMGIEPTIESATRPKVQAWPRPGLTQTEILEMCGSGILVTGFNGGNSNSSTGDFSYGIEGFAFENGKITHPVREMLITGNFITLWNNLIAAGEDVRGCMSKVIPTLAFSNVDFSA
ncbi:MAG: TldD/PmbA family protein [Bacteroidales bacterium]|nr:TldD/PmbA family protein [Bacteroidales bacterium]